MPKTKSEALTPNMLKVLRLIASRLSQGSSPSLIEIARHCSWRSTATAFDVVERLRFRRLIRRHGHDFLILAAANQYLETV